MRDFIHYPLVHLKEVPLWGEGSGGEREDNMGMIKFADEADWVRKTQARLTQLEVVVRWGGGGCGYGCVIKSCEKNYTVESMLICA